MATMLSSATLDFMSVDLNRSRPLTPATAQKRKQVHVVNAKRARGKDRKEQNPLFQPIKFVASRPIIA